MIHVDKTDPELGQEVQTVLEENGVSTPTDGVEALSDNQKITSITYLVKEIMTTLGLDLTDDSLSDTPKRVAKMFVQEIYSGLNPSQFPKCTAVDNKMGYDEMVLEKNIAIKSMCEHHWMPIAGVAHIAYIPDGKVLGLSKLNRVANYFARRPQIQERLAEQIYFALSYILDTEDIAVVIDADHFCVKHRGIMDENSHTITSKLGGCFKSDPAVRAEFMSLIKE